MSSIRTGTPAYRYPGTDGANNDDGRNLNTYRAAFDARAHGGPWLVEWWKGGVFKGYIADGFASEIDAQSVVVALAIAEVKRI
jgi:hypothetical protein